MENIKDIIEQGEKEFRKLEMRGYNIPAGEGFAVCSDNTIWRAEDILNWHKSQQHKLLQSIMDEIDQIYILKEKNQSGRVVATMPHELSQYSKGFNASLDSLKSKLLDITKEK